MGGTSSSSMSGRKHTRKERKMVSIIFVSLQSSFLWEGWTQLSFWAEVAWCFWTFNLKNHKMWYKAQIIWFIILTNNGFQNMWTFPRVLWGWQPVYLPPAEMSTGKFITARRKVQWEWTFLRVVYFVNMLSASEHPQKCPLPKFHCTVVHHMLYTSTFCCIRTGCQKR